MPTIERNALNTGAKPIENDDLSCENTSSFLSNLHSDENQNITSKPEDNHDLLDLIGLNLIENGTSSDIVANNYSKNILDLNNFLVNDDCTKVQQHVAANNLIEGIFLILFI